MCFCQWGFQHGITWHQVSFICHIIFLVLFMIPQWSEPSDGVYFITATTARTSSCSNHEGHSLSLVFSIASNLQLFFSGLIFFLSHTLSPLTVALPTIPALRSWSPTTISSQSHLAHLRLTVVHLTLLVLQVQEDCLVRMHGLCHQGERPRLGPREETLQRGAGARVGELMKQLQLTLLLLLPIWVSRLQWNTLYPSLRDQTQGQVGLEMRNHTRIRSRHKN